MCIETLIAKVVKEVEYCQVYMRFFIRHTSLFSKLNDE